MSEKFNFNLPPGVKVDKKGQTEIDFSYKPVPEKDNISDTFDEPLKNLKDLIAEKGVKPDEDGFYSLEEIIGKKDNIETSENTEELDNEELETENTPLLYEQYYSKQQPVENITDKKRSKSKNRTRHKKTEKKEGGYEYPWQEIYNR